MTPLLQVDRLVKEFPAGRGFFTRRPPVRAVDDVSFSIEAGETAKDAHSVVNVDDMASW